MRRFGLAPVLLGGLALVVAVTSPALAHEHPSGITDLVTPAVVRVEAKARVDVTLLDHIGELVHIERSYEVPIGVGTGIVVNPEGAIVTLARVVKSDRDVEVYAANKVFSEHHKVKIADDFKRHTLQDDRLNHHLRECYPPKRATSTCIIDVTTEIRVFPNISPPDEEGFKAKVVYSGDDLDSPAVLEPVGRADGSAGLPTAPLAASVPAQEASPVAIAGFVGRPAAGLRETVDIAHLRAGGAGEGGRRFADPKNQVNEPEKVGALIDKGLLGGPVIEDKKGAVVGLLAGGGKDGRMIGVREITKALAEAKVTPRHGPVDAAFEQALTRFHTHYYGDAVPAFERVLDLYPGHTVAAAHLKTAQQKRGTAEDAGFKAAAPAQARDTRLPLWPFLVGGGLLVLVVLVVAFLLWRRGGRPEEERRPRDPSDSQPGLGTSRPGISGLRTSGPPTTPAGPPSPEEANPTVVVGRSFPALPKVTSTSPGGPVLVARNPGTEPSASDTGIRPVESPSQKYCTACGMRLGPAHRFCGYCGNPSET